MLSVFFESSYSLLQGIVNMLLLIGVGTSVTCIRAFDEEVKYKVRIRKRGRKVHVRKPSDKERTLRKHGSTPACKAHSPSESGPSASSSSSTVRAKDLHPAYISDESYFRVSERMMKPYASSVPGIPRKFEIRPAQGFENGRFPPAAEKGNFAKTYGNCNYGYDYGRDYKQAKHYGGYERNKNTAENPYEFGYNYEENYEGGKQEKENKGYEHYDKTGGRTKEKIFETLQVPEHPEHGGEKITDEGGDILGPTRTKPAEALPGIDTIIDNIHEKHGKNRQKQHPRVIQQPIQHQKKQVVPQRKFDRAHEPKKKRSKVPVQSYKRKQHRKRGGHSMEESDS